MRQTERAGDSPLMRRWEFESVQRETDLTASLIGEQSWDYLSLLHSLSRMSKDICD